MPGTHQARRAARRDVRDRAAARRASHSVSVCCASAKTATPAYEIGAVAALAQRDRVFVGRQRDEGEVSARIGRRAGALRGARDRDATPAIGVDVPDSVTMPLMPPVVPARARRVSAVQHASAKLRVARYLTIAYSAAALDIRVAQPVGEWCASRTRDTRPLPLRIAREWRRLPALARGVGGPCESAMTPCRIVSRSRNRSGMSWSSSELTTPDVKSDDSRSWLSTREQLVRP